jgi:hypothetical protein
VQGVLQKSKKRKKKTASRRYEKQETLSGTSDCIALEIGKQAQHNVLLYVKIQLNFDIYFKKKLKGRFYSNKGKLS